MNRWCNILMIGSAMAVIVLTIITGIQSRQNNYKGTRYMCKDPDINYVLLHTNYNGDTCEGDVQSTYQTPLNECYNNGYMDRRDEITDYNCYDGRPNMMEQIYYTTNDGSCGTVDNDTWSRGSIGYCGTGCTWDGDCTSESIKLIKITA